ncbi:hypothetical protein TW80_13815 [Loktanella sp. S4079]|nr:hypothetical protein TW80_13815 [Loktanella sp. S4079]
MRRNNLRYVLGLYVIAVVLIVLLAGISLFFGIRDVAPGTVIGAFTAFDGTNPDHVVVLQMRIPRAVIAALGGGSLGVAGALMQVFSRNPLADPGLLGINGGAALGVVIAIWGLRLVDQTDLVIPALIGAAIAAGLVLLLGGSVRKNGPDPTRFVLAGAAIGALFLAFTWAILILSRESLDVYRFWVLGAFSGVSMANISSLLPLYAIGLPMAVISAMLLNQLVLGDDTARALGVRIGIARVLTVLTVVILCGTTVSLAGPIAFIGLVVPHVVRPFVGANISLLTVGAFFAGGILALFADILGRVLLPGSEIEAGAMMALIGGPVLILLVRMKRGVRL